MPEDKKQIGPMGLDLALVKTGETVSRLAIELAKLAAAEDNESPDVDGAVPDAWRLLRRACLEIETEGKERTIEDYKRFRIRPPKELVEASRPSPPPPYRELFETLFSKDQATIYLPSKSKSVEGLNGTFEWRQLTPLDAASQPASAELKTRPYQIAWAVIDSRVRQGINKIVRHVSLDEMLCFGFNWAWGWHNLDSWMAKRLDQNTGSFDPWLNREEWECLARCANELPRPHNRSVGLAASVCLTNDSEKSKLLLDPDSDRGLPGPNPPDGTTAEALYEQAKIWAEDVLEAWKKELVQLQFEAFWAEGKERGFLWADVMAMALHTKKHKGGIKWHSSNGPTMPSGQRGEDGEVQERYLGRMWTPRDFKREDVGW